MKQFKRIIILLILFSLLLPTTRVKAQTPTTIQINYTEVTEGEESLTLGVYFTLIDENGLPITNPSVQSAEIIQLDNNARSTASAARADTPFYIVMVLDASGSMARADEDMRNAASQALSGAPNGARFAVIRFNNVIDLLQDFTEVEDRVLNAISQVESIPDAGTCLYDATYQAIEMLGATPPGRRAVILFTDGRDEVLGGAPCSTHVFDEVVDLANDPAYHVPIHTIGMSAASGNINRTELESMASSTGGFSVVGSQSSLESMFDQIMDVLNSQMLATAEMFPTQGEHDAVLQITTRDGATLTATFSFSSSRDYLLPPSMSLERVSYDVERDIYSVFLNFTSPQLIDHVKIATWDARSGVQVSEVTFRDLTATQTYEISTEGLEIGREYEFRIEALGSGEEVVNDIEGEPLSIVHDFRYEREVIETELAITSVAVQNQELLVNMQLTDAGQVVAYEGWLIEGSTNSQVTSTIFKTTTTTSPIAIPLAGLAGGKYTVVVRALDANNQMVVEAQYENVSYTPPTPPSKISVLISQLVNGLKANPWILVAIFLVLLFGMLGLIAIPLIARRQSGTPVLQGKIETTLPSDKGSPLNLTRSLERPEAAQRPRPEIPSKPRQAPQPPPRDAMPQPRPAPPPQRPAPAARPAAPAPAASYCLRILVSPEAARNGQIVRLTQATISMGREDCDLLFPNDRKISRRHATVSFNATSGQYYVTDLASSNGVFVNNVRIAPNQATPLTPGTIFMLGPDTRIVFEKGG